MDGAANRARRKLISLDYATSCEKKLRKEERSASKLALPLPIERMGCLFSQSSCTLVSQKNTQRKILQ